MTTTKDSILIVGGNGKTGARVDRRLKALGYATRPVSRSTSPSFDWDNPATWQAAVRGARAAYVTYQPDLAVPGAASAIEAFAQLAVEQGLEHIVLLSGRGEEGARRAEARLKASGIAWTIVRSSWFCQNFSESFMLEGILAGELCLPAGDTVEPFVDADDIAEVVTAALTEPGHRGKLYEVTGPRALTFAQSVETIAGALGQPVKYTSVPVDDYIEALREAGVSKDMQWLLRELFTVVFDGRNSGVMPGVEEALGRRPTDFTTYVQKTLESGVWHGGMWKESA